MKENGNVSSNYRATSSNVYHGSVRGGKYVMRCCSVAEWELHMQADKELATSRPMLFSGPMVRALLADTKTQTRRIVKPQPPADVAVRYAPIYCGPDVQNDPVPVLAWRPPGEFSVVKLPCPYGQRGDRLWVRETWAELLHTSPSTNEPSLCEGDKLIEHATRRADGRGWHYDGTVIAYRATSDVQFCDGDGFDSASRWKPSIHMRREHSRITLEITDVRVEQLQQISGNDVLAEGVDNGKANAAMGARWDNMQRMAFGELWESIYGPGSWDPNPLVWALTFKRIP